MRMFAICLVACSSPSTKPAQPTPVVADASVDAVPDAGISAALAAAPAWVFRYNAPGRLETWTLRYAGGDALVVVESARGPITYTGTAEDGASLKLAVKAGATAMALDCKREQLAVGLKCGDKTTKKIDVLSCYHPDFKSPMSFGAAPGIEFAGVDGCNGYRFIAPAAP
jgi:hypothetical protein